MDDIYHHGIKGQRWGVRRYQNKDGSLTPAGQKRLEKKDAKWAHKNYDKIASKARKDVSKEDVYKRQDFILFRKLFWHSGYDCLSK